MKLPWRLSRLRRMRPHEPALRLWALARQAVSPSGTGHPGGIFRPLPWASAPPVNPTAVARAVHTSGIPILGTMVAPADRCRFAHDPASRQPWPEVIDELQGQSLDPRMAWELSRLQHLALLAAADPHDPTPRDDAREFRRQHPPGHGLPWAGTLEVALRLVSLAQIAAAWPTPDLRLSIAEHAQWLLRAPSVGSSARNHRVAELAALAVAAWVLPGAADRGRWLREAQELATVLAEQVHRDGAGIEQSTHYLAFVVEWALVARSVGAQGVGEPLLRATRFLSRLVTPSGSALQIGDDDDGRVVACHLGPERHYVTSVVGAACTALGESPPKGWHPDRRTALLAPTIPELRANPGSAWFPAGGLTVLRAPGRMVAIDHGPLGEPDLGAHGHADALAVWVHVDGGPVIVGRGTGCYNGDRAARRFHRGTAAHPTVVVDGLSQSQPHDHPFLWRTRARTVLHELDIESGMVVASHNGYRGRLGIVHRRRIELAGDVLILEDALLGSGTHHVAIHLPLAPGLRALGESGRIEVEGPGGRLLEIQADPRCTMRIVEGGHRPGVGQHSRIYGTWEPACTVILEARGRLPLELCTVIRFPAVANPAPSP